MGGDFYRRAVLVTGGTGFIGGHLVNVLLQQDADVTILSRHNSSPGAQGFKIFTGDLARPDTLDGVCQGRDVVFHLGGYAHAMDEFGGKGEEINRQVTVEGTRALVEQSLKAGVSRFVFFSSVKAMGEGGEACADEAAACQPTTEYGRAKREAEKIVLDAARSGLPVVVLRMPMVYGPGAKGNLSRMIQAVAQGRFPPLPDTNNKRSMVDVRDVVQAALLVAERPEARGQVYIVTDGRTYSTRQIYEWICAVLQRPPPRWTVPISWLRLAAFAGDAIGRLRGRRFVLDSAALEKLLGSAWYSSEKISRELNYRPVHTLKDSLPEMVAEFRKIA